MAQVYLDESGESAARSVSAGAARPATAHPTGFHLVFRENGRHCPVTMWEPVPPEGYVALGTLVEGAPQVPETAEVLTVRADLARPTRTFDAPAWRWDPPALQVCPCAGGCPDQNCVAACMLLPLPGSGTPPVNRRCTPFLGMAELSTRGRRVAVLVGLCRERGAEGFHVCQCSGF